MDAKAVIVVGILAVLITMAIVVFFPLSCKLPCATEGFLTPLQMSCPSGSKSFYDDHGDLLCCQGQVNGKSCDGRILCTFSGNNSKYPVCGLERKRKYIGPINPFVQQLMATDFVQKFKQGLDGANKFIPTLQSLPPNQLSPKDFAIVKALLAEETEWLNDNLDGDSLLFQEECMYIIQRLTTTFNGKPIVNNPAIVQNAVLKQACGLGPSSGSGVPAGEDPRCYANGKLVGTLSNDRGNKFMSYTKEQCNQISGVYDDSNCAPPNAVNPRMNIKEAYNIICIPK
jgi:hypothetical protein